MIHHYCQGDTNNHFAVGVSTHPIKQKDSRLILQVQENGNQARIQLTLEESQFLVKLLNENIVKLLQPVA